MSHVTQPNSIVILGAGYGGLLCAVRLAGRLRREMRNGSVDLTLVNASDQFVERVRLHQIAGGFVPRRRAIPEILRRTGVRFVKANIRAFDPNSRKITLETRSGTETLPYSTLVYALGSLIDVESVPGVARFAFTLSPTGERGVPGLSAALNCLSETGGDLTVVGSGATGIEAAAEFAARFPRLRVRLITAGVFASFSIPPVIRKMRRALERLNVEIVENTRVTDVSEAEVQTAGGSRYVHDLCLWAGGFRAPALARDAGLAVNEQGRAWVDQTMRAVEHQNVFVIGDAAIPRVLPGIHYRMSAVVATITGAYAADQIAALVRGKPLMPLRFAYLGQGIALGPGKAVGYGSYPADIPQRPILTGRLGALIREIAVRYLANAASFERRLTGVFLFWQHRKKPVLRSLGSALQIHAPEG